MSAAGEIALNTLKKKLEAEGEKKVVELLKKPIDANTVGKTLVNIMKDGATEFREKTGRNMTYSEMREMYG